MSKLTAAKRRKLPASDFALSKGHYPDDTKGRARAALSRISAHGTPSQKEKVRKRVHAKYPSINVSGLKKGKKKSSHKRVARKA